MFTTWHPESRHWRKRWIWPSGYLSIGESEAVGETITLNTCVYIYNINIYIYRVVAWGSPEGNWSSLLSTLKNVCFIVFYLYIYIYKYAHTIYTYIHSICCCLIRRACPIEIESILKFRCDKSWSPDLEVVMVAKLTSWHGMLSGWWGC